MLNDLFINGCVLVSMLFISSEFLKNRDFSPNFSISKRIFSGFIYGILSIILIIYNVRVTDTAFFDFRHIAHVVSALHGGSISVIITGLITAIFRAYYYGLTHNSIITSAGIMITCIFFAFISTPKMLKYPKHIRYISMLIYSLVIKSILFVLVLDKMIDVFEDILSLWIGTIVFSFIVYHLLKYLEVAHAQLYILKKQANIDYLTGVNNVRSFNKLFDDVINLSKKSGMPFSVLMVDLDNFKQVNDNYGHMAGDNVLKQFGLILLTICKNDFIVGRVGGEEFCLILKNSSKNEAFEFAQKIRKLIETHAFTLHSGLEIKVTTSIGVASYKETVSDIYKVKEVADEKLYKAKNSGRNKVCI